MHALFIDYKEIVAAYGLDELHRAFVARELVQKGDGLAAF